MGQDPECGVCLADPFLNPRHARIFKDKRNRWVIKDCDSLNGLWVRVPNKLLDHGTEFLLGGQRFLFNICQPDPAANRSGAGVEER